MPQQRRTKQQQIDELERTLDIEQRGIEESRQIIRHLQEQNTLLKDQVKALETDKSWLKSMHSNMLQATAEMFRNR